MGGLEKVGGESEGSWKDWERVQRDEKESERVGELEREGED